MTRVGSQRHKKSVVSNEKSVYALQPVTGGFNKLLHSRAAAVQEGLVDGNAPFQTYVNQRAFICINP